MSTFSCVGYDSEATRYVSEEPPLIRDAEDVADLVAMVLAFGGAEIIALSPIILWLAFTS